MSLNKNRHIFLNKFFFFDIVGRQFFKNAVKCPEESTGGNTGVQHDLLERHISKQFNCTFYSNIMCVSII